MTSQFCVHGGKVQQRTGVDGKRRVADAAEKHTQFINTSLQLTVTTNLCATK